MEPEEFIKKVREVFKLEIKEEPKQVQKEPKHYHEIYITWQHEGIVDAKCKNCGKIFRFKVGEE